VKKTALTLLLMLTLIISVAGCTEEETAPTPTPILTPTPTLTPKPTPTATPTPAPNPTPRATATATPTLTPTTTVLFLEITQPADGVEVSTSPINVTGKTIPGAVVSISINDEMEIVTVGQDGKFAVKVTLEEGPNLIEVIASDPLGNEKSATVAVVYIP